MNEQLNCKGCNAEIYVIDGYDLPRDKTLWLCHDCTLNEIKKLRKINKELNNTISENKKLVEESKDEKYLFRFLRFGILIVIFAMLISYNHTGFAFLLLIIMCLSGDI